jgi:polyisoprenoid-binding protein YceI
VSRFRIVPERSQVFIGARSSLHPINTRTDGLEGFLELTVDGDGAIDLSVPPKGRLSLPVDRLSSGNPLEDRELRRRIDVRRYPTIQGDLVEMDRVDNGEGRYRVRGDLTVKGVTNRYQDAMTITPLDDRTLQLEGETTFDIREFGIDPPRMLMLKVEPQINVRVKIVAEREDA